MNNWIELESETDLDKIIKESHSSDAGIAIFKHSTRCPVSTMAKRRLSSKWDFNDELPFYHLDLIKHRKISNLIAHKFAIPHESPQFLLIKDGECVYETSHGSVSVDGVKSFLNK